MENGMLKWLKEKDLTEIVLIYMPIWIFAAVVVYYFVKGVVGVFS
jgi:hypothetical protein